MALNLEMSENNDYTAIVNEVLFVNEKTENDRRLSCEE